MRRSWESGESVIATINVMMKMTMMMMDYLFRKLLEKKKKCRIEIGLGY